MNSPSWLPSPLAPLTGLSTRQTEGSLHWFTSHELLVPAPWETYQTADVPQTPALRAQALASWVVRDGVLSHDSALWVHLGGTPPAIVHITSPRALRNASSRRRFYCAQLTEADSSAMGQTRVTTRTRTACDLARRRPTHGTDTIGDGLHRIQRIAELLDGPGELEEAQKQIGLLHGQPGKATARALFSQIEAWRSASLV